MATALAFACSAARRVAVSAVLMTPISVAALAATSDSLYDNYFANVLGGAPCFARTYDPVQLQDHPEQRVKEIEVYLSKSNADGMPNSPDRFALDFALMTRSGSNWYGQSARCRTNDADFVCFVASDGGVFTLTPQKDGGLRFEAGDGGISVEGSQGDDGFEISGKANADEAFDLIPSHAECQSASTMFMPDEDNSDD
jgi:hypothetical protein